MSKWIYILGERGGADLKIGSSGEPTLRKRLRTVNGEANDDEYVLLAAVRGNGTDETTMRRPFRIKPKGSRREYVYADDDAVGYAAWLRSQWFATLDIDEQADPLNERPPDEWLPGPGRVYPKPPIDPDKMVQDYDTVPGQLAGTCWAWMPNPKASFQDYFTPVEIVNAARDAMGGIDLDAASHWAAQKVHRIPHYFDVTRSAFDHPWFGRVWLNPPYGHNEPWFDCIQKHVQSGAVEQLCMLSPMWAFQTSIARPVMELASGLVLLSPTPKFWGNADPDKTGTNNPHGIVYIGPEPTRFNEAFAEFGFPMRFAWGT